MLKPDKSDLVGLKRNVSPLMKFNSVEIYYTNSDASKRATLEIEAYDRNNGIPFMFLSWVILFIIV